MPNLPHADIPKARPMGPEEFVILVIAVVLSVNFETIEIVAT